MQIKFEINEEEFFFIDSNHENIEDLQMCEEPSWFYSSPFKILRVIGPYNCCLVAELEGLMILIRRLLSNKLELDTTRLPNIGYQWNERLYALAKGRGKWEGADYLWFSGSDGETFIYTIDGIIHLEITPTYPWLFGAKPKGIKKIPFKDFLKNYKPYVRTTIPREAVLQWLTLAQNLRHIIDQNQKRLEQSSE